MSGDLNDYDLARGHAPQDSEEIRRALSASDLEMIRVLEDLIALLIDKGQIALTELPPAAQEKLDRRLSLRARLADLDELVDEADDYPLP